MKTAKPKWNWIALALFALWSLSISFRAAQNQFARGSADNAFLMEIIENLSRRLQPLTMVAQSTSIASPTWMQNSEEICAATYPLPAEPLNYFKKAHPYLLLYVLSPLNYVLGAADLLALLMALSFLGLGLFLLLQLRIAKVSWVVSIFFVHMLMTHPAWIGGLEGQAYMDRLFLFLGGVLFWYGFKLDTKPQLMFLILLIVVALINDRTGIQAAIVLGGYGVLYWGKSAGSKWLVIVSSLLMAFSLYLILVYVQGYEPTKFAKGLSLWARLQTLSSSSAWTLWTYSAILLGPWTLKNWRFILIAAAALAPNALVTVGGAERTGWGTHYHSGYLPALAVLSAYSFIEQYKSGGFYRRVGYGVYILIATILFMGLSRDFSTSNTFAFSWKNSAYAKTVSLSDFEPSFESSIREELKKVIPPGAIVSTTESNFKFLWGYAELLYYPTGIDDADFILLAQTSDLEYPNSALTYLGKGTLTAINRCLWERMIKSHPRVINIPNSQFVVLSKL